MTNMSSKIMSSETPSPSASCEVINEVHHHDDEPGRRDDYNAATLKLQPPQRECSHDEHELPDVGFTNCSDVVSQQPHEDHIEQLSEEGVVAAGGTKSSLHSAASTVEVNHADKEQDNECGVTCLYYVLQCCDCAIM